MHGNIVGFYTFPMKSTLLGLEEMLIKLLKNPKLSN